MVEHYRQKLKRTQNRFAIKEKRLRVKILAVFNICNLNMQVYIKIAIKQELKNLDSTETLA